MYVKSFLHLRFVTRRIHQTTGHRFCLQVYLGEQESNLHTKEGLHIMIFIVTYLRLLQNVRGLLEFWHIVYFCSPIF